jgi:hypothetical protein
LNRKELFHILNDHRNELENPSFYNAFLSEEEECPFCCEVNVAIERSVTLYREETIHTEVPTDVGRRLRTVIKQQWNLNYNNIEDEEV